MGDSTLRATDTVTDVETDVETDYEMMALTNSEIKDRFKEIWTVIEGGGETAYDFKEYCEGFEHLCAGVLKLKNYCCGRDDKIVFGNAQYMDQLFSGVKEIFEKIKSDFVKEKI